MTVGRPVRVTDGAGLSHTIAPDDESYLEPLGPDRVRLHASDGRLVDVIFDVGHGRPDDPQPVEILVGGWRFVLTIEDEERAILRERARRGAAVGEHAGRAEIRSVIPGRVVAVGVVEGDIVAAGDRLLVVEAMKMQNEIRSPSDGTILRVGVGVGRTVEIGDVLVVVG